jgi:hypothetical protein
MFIVKVCHTIINNYYVEGRSHHTQIGREQLIINEFDLDRENKVDVALLVGQFPIDFRLLGEKITMCHRDDDDDGVRENRSTHAPLFIFVFFSRFPVLFFGLLGLMYLVVFLRSCIRLTS